MYQDLIFTMGTIVFIIALIPSIIGQNKPDAATSIMSFIVLFIFGITYYSIHLYLTAFLTFIISVLWFVLALQVMTRKRK